MDKLSRLAALTGNGKVVDQNKLTQRTWFTPTKQPSNIYEGSDTEDEEEMTGGGQIAQISNGQTAAMVRRENGICHVDTTMRCSYELTQGELAPEGVKFMTFKSGTKYPYQFIGRVNSQKVAEGFFDRNQVYGHTYDLFYLYPGASSSSQPIILIPTKQFENLLNGINSVLKTKLSIPNGAAGDAFYTSFPNDGNPVPRYLGRSSNKDEFDNLKAQIPPYYFKITGESASNESSDSAAQADFLKKLASLTVNEKGSKAANKAKKAEKQVNRQESWASVVKRVQCYIGIRDLQAQTTFFDAATSMKYKPQDSVVFISVDVEAYELDHKKVTEIGIATLDTLDIRDFTPGVGGSEWMKKIRARHFRIQEYRHLVNHQHVHGCPDSFEFGESEFISIKEAPSKIASCFKDPFSGPVDLTKGIDLAQPKRTIVLVGHAISGDVDFMKDIGYDVTNLSNLKDTIDTGDMWKYIKKVLNPASLAIILHELGITGWNLHNAGNDAVYTLQAMVGLAIKNLVEKDMPVEKTAVSQPSGAGQEWDIDDGYDDY